MPGLTIDNVFWLARSNAAQKQYSSLVLAVTTPEDANNIMDNGIILGSEFKDAVLYDSTGRPTQCYNCLGLDGHTSARCTNPPRCGNCAEAHGTRECPSKTDQSKRRCHNCDKPHAGWSRYDCPKLVELYKKA
ncbi:hypothetical protein BJ546DRAFT_867986, partial [Cryomyces antarcticus]